MFDKVDMGALASLPPTDLLVVGARQGNTGEERFDAVRERIGASRCLQILRSRLNTAHVFDLILDQSPIAKEISWSRVREVVSQNLESRLRAVVLDITTLELESLLYLIPIITSLGPADMHAAYAIPNKYRQQSDKNAEVLTFQEIQQPRGYVTFPREIPEGHASRIFFLGFDRGRALKFVLKYNWPDHEIWPVLGDPPFVDGGVKHAWESNEALINMAPHGQLTRVPAEGAAETREFLADRFHHSDHLDIVPVGPKPLLLGAVLFYFSLTEEDRRRVRFLYDFPSPRPSRTTGVARIVVYDCGLFL